MVIRGRTIVCLASSWNYDPTSKHQIMKILARHNEIIWVNYHGTRRPGLTKADLRAAWSVLCRFAGGIRRVGPSFVQVTPLVLPGVTNTILHSIHERMLIAQIRRAIRSVAGTKERPLQVWAFAPDVPYLAGQFGEECFLYYCVDDYSEFEGLDAARISAVEGDLIRRSDLIVTTSEALWEKNRVHRPDTVLVRHGVDYDLFSSAWRSKLERPADMAAIRGPVLGFFGLIQFWVDCDLIARVARLRPHYSFVLIGDCATNVSELEKLPNVHFLGRRSNAELPAYCAAFDAALMPFTQNPMTRSINPIKMYEYLAAGLPVISTPLPEARRFAGAIAITDSPEGFAKACDDALASDYPGRREAISTLVADQSWTSKVEILSEIIENKLRPVARTASKPAREVFPSRAALPTHPVSSQTTT